MTARDKLKRRATIEGYELMEHGVGNILLGIAAILSAVGGFYLGLLKINREKREMKAWLNAKVRQANGVPIAYIESLPFPGWIKDEDGRYIFVNQEYGKEFDTRLADVEGRTDFELWDQDTAKKFVHSDRQVLIDKQRMEFVERVPDKIGKDAISSREWKTIKWPIFGDAGKLVAVGGVAVELSTPTATEQVACQPNRRIGRRPGTGEIKSGSTA